MSELFSGANLTFILKGFALTLYISFVSIILSTIFGTILAIMRNGKNKLFKVISGIYIEFVRNVPNLLWIFIIFLVFQIGNQSVISMILISILQILVHHHKEG